MMSIKFNFVRTFASLLVAIVFLSFVNSFGAQTIYRKLPKEEEQIYLDLKNGKYQTVVDMASELIKKNPRNLRAYESRSYALVELKEFDRAVSDFKKILKLSDNPPYYEAKNLAEKLEGAKQHQKAIEVYTGIIGRMPKDKNAQYYLPANFYLLRARQYKTTGDIKNSITDYTSCINGYNPPNEAYLERAELYEKKNNIRSAVFDLNRALKSEELLKKSEELLKKYPDNAYGHWLKATALISLNKLNEAMIEYEIFKKIKPNDAEAFRLFGVEFYYTKLSDPKAQEKLISVLLDTIKAKPTAPDFDNLADCYKKTNKTELAIQNYKRSLELDPGKNECRRKLIKLFQKTGKLEELANQYLEYCRNTSYPDDWKSSFLKRIAVLRKAGYNKKADKERARMKLFEKPALSNEEVELTEDQIFNRLSERTWLEHPMDYIKSNESLVFAKKFQYKYEPTNVPVPARMVVGDWSFQKHTKGGGWVFLDNGSALRFAFYKDGTLTLLGHRFYPGPKTKTSITRTDLAPVTPSSIFKKLTANAWSESPVYQPVPQTVRYLLDGTIERSKPEKGQLRPDLANLKSRRYWSLVKLSTGVDLDEFNNDDNPNIFFESGSFGIAFSPDGGLRTNMQYFIKEGEEIAVPELSEEEMFHRLMSSTWRCRVPEDKLFYGIANKMKKQDKEVLAKISSQVPSLDFDGATLNMNHQYYGKGKSYKWNFKKCGKNFGWIFLGDGSAVRYTLFPDGSASFYGRRFFPWDKNAQNFKLQDLNRFEPGDKFKQLTGNGWIKSHDFNCVYSYKFGEDGTVNLHEVKAPGTKELHNQKRFWSLLTCGGEKKCSLILHYYNDGDGLNYWNAIDFIDKSMISITSQFPLFRCNVDTFVPDVPNRKEGIVFDKVADYQIRATYPRPIITGKPVTFDINLTPDPDPRLRPRKGINKFKIVEYTLKRDTAKKNSFVPEKTIFEKVYEVGEVSNKEQKKINVDLVFNKDRRTGVQLQLIPSNWYRGQTSLCLMYKP